MTVKEFCQIYETGQFTDPLDNPEDAGWYRYICDKNILHIHLISIYEILTTITNPILLNAHTQFSNYMDEDNHVNNMIALQIKNFPLIAVNIDTTITDVDPEQPFKYTFCLKPDETGYMFEMSISSLRYVTAFLNGIRTDDNFKHAFACYKQELEQRNKELDEETAQLQRINQRIDEIKQIIQDTELIKEEIWIHKHNKTKYM